MAKINLDNSTIDVLEVVLNDNTYNVPLGSSLPYKKLKTLDNPENIIAFFAEYIPGIEELPFTHITAVINAWKKATEEATGVSLEQS